MHIDIHTRHVSLNPRDPAFFNDPYPTYEHLRLETPVFFWQEFGFWCFMQYDDVNRILRDRRFGRQILHVMTPEELGWPPEREDLRPFLEVERYSLLELEPPAHTRLRTLVQRPFTRGAIERLRPQLTNLCHILIDQMLQRGPGCDLLTTYATPIPVTIIAQMLGVPIGMTDAFLAWSHAMVTMYELGTTPEQERAAVQATTEFVAYLKDYIEWRKHRMGTDLLSQLLVVEEAGEMLSEKELISTCILLLNAGHEATVHTLGNAVFALLSHPQQLHDFQQGSISIPDAVEELLRYDPPLHLFNRWVLEESEIQGLSLPRGTQVAVLLAAANRDPHQFSVPWRLDLSRKPNPHLSFGGGIHYCLGAPLARLELQIALPILFDRIPNMRLVEPPQYRDSYHFHGLQQLLIGW